MKVKAIIAIVAFGLMTAVSAFAQTTTVEQPTTVAQSTPEAVMGAAPASMSPSPELVAAKRAAAQKYLEMDVIKFKVFIKDNGGIGLAVTAEAYPKKGKVKSYGTGTYCELTHMETKFEITHEGDLSMEIFPRMRGCSHAFITIDPLLKKVELYRVAEDGSMTPGVARWVLDN